MMNSERKFKSDFSKALAEAIISNEGKSYSSTVITIDEIKDTYRSLCFDDPIVDSDRKCRALALTLVDGIPLDHIGLEIERCDTMKFGLSDPFMKGVLHTSRQRDEVKGKSTTNTSTSNDNDIDDFHYNGEGIVNSTNASQGYAELAFVVLLVGPLQCVKNLLSNDERGKTWICSFLGGYNGRENDVPSQMSSNEDDIHHFLRNMNDFTLDETEEEKKDLSTSSQNEDIHNNNNDDDDDHDDDDSMREIFAEESDPDDYDYGDDRYNAQSLHNMNESILVIDSEVLSKPKILSKSEMQFRIESLLHELTYSRLAYMSKKIWKEWNASKILIELTLTLVQCLEDIPGHDFESLAMLYTKPLMVLRDRALDSNHGHDCLDEYVNLIEIFLISEASQVGRTASKVREDNLSPSQVIGLSALSALCTNHTILSSSKSSERKMIRNVFFNAQNALLDCLEFIRRQRKSANDAWVRVVLALVSILDFVTSNNSKGDVDKGFISPLTTAESQSLIQSGLFREILLLYTDTSDETTTASVAESIAKDHLLRTIMIMCAQSPTILFKYASRVPELTNILYSLEFSKVNMGDCILWYALLASVQDNGASVIRFKNTITKSKDELFDQCILSTVSLFSSLRESLSQTNDVNQKVIYDTIWMLNVLQSSPFAIECWKKVADKDSRVMNAISSTLNSLHAVKLPQESSLTDQDKKIQNSNMNNEKTIINAELVAKIRKGCKYLLFAMEQSESSGKSNAVRGISSKTD